MKYKNKKWLYNKYWNKELSVQKIADLCGVTHKTINYWMKKFAIIRRSQSKIIHLRQVNHCELSTNAIEWINGELLGDGCLQSHSEYSARFNYSSKFLEYIQYISNNLQSFGIKQTGKISKYYLKRGNSYIHYYTSRCYVELLSIYKQWYLNRKKIIPKDLRLTPLTCKQWYIGDGCLMNQEKRYSYIRLATDCFSISDVKYLVKQLNELGFKTTRQPNNNTIRISAYSTEDFLNYIGKCPVKCYEYKWNNRNRKIKR